MAEGQAGDRRSADVVDRVVHGSDVSGPRHETVSNRQMSTSRTGS
jgi:hypothetical protein